MISNFLTDFLIALIIVVIIHALGWSYNNFIYFKLFFPVFVLRHGKRIRISISYLFRINVDNKYLLIKGDRINQYQPVGGVYKHLDSTSDFLNNLGLVPDHDNFRYEEKVRNDLRKFTVGKKIFRVIHWFNKGHDRELGPWREFYEELIKSDILPKDIFPYIFYKYIRQHVTPLRYSQHLKCHEILIADIYELLPTQEQTQALKQLLSKTDDDRYVWVNRETIERKGHDILKGITPFKIAETAQWTIQE